MNKFRKIDDFYMKERIDVAKRIGKPELFDIADQFGLYSGMQTIGRGLAIYEYLKQAIKVPGDIAEFGCWKGANLLFMAKILHLLQPNSLRQVHGFDSFEGLQTFAPEDGEEVKEKFRDTYKGDEKTLREFIALHEMEAWVHLVVGDALQTIDTFAAENPHKILCLSFIDFDLYEPCKKALEFSDERLSVGGFIILDEALTDNWKGEGKALREFLDARKGCYQSSANTISRQPTVILKKIQ